MPKEPYLDATGVKSALDALRQAAPLGGHVLAGFLIARRVRQSPEAVEGAVAAEQVVYNLLVEHITVTLERLRRLEGLPFAADTERAAAEAALRQDFWQGNTELEAWSVLYYRYVRVDLDLQMQSIAAIASQELRTVRRRLKHGITRLTAQLIEAERVARARQACLRMRLALPSASPPRLYGMTDVTSRALDALNATPPCPVVLHGAGGLGKTALASYLAHCLIEQEQDAIDDLVWLHGAPSDALPTRLLEGLGQSAAHPDPLMALRAYAQTYRLLVVLDAAESLVADARALDTLLGALGAARVVITSRTAPPAVCDLLPLTLHEFDAHDAWEFMEHEFERTHGKPSDTPRRSADFARVWEAVGGNPLALRVAVGHLRFFAADRVAGLLAQLPAGGQTLFDALYRAAWDALDADARRLWLALLLYPSEHAASIDDLEQLGLPVALESAVLTLARRALIEVWPADAVPRYSLPRLTCAFLIDMLASAEGRALETCVTDAARALSTVLIDGGDVPAALVIARGVHLLTQAARFALDVDVLSLAAAVHGHVAELGRWAAWLPLVRRLRDAGVVSAPGGKALLQVWQGEAERHLGELDAAAITLLEAIRLADAAACKASHAAALVELAAVYRLAGRPGAALTAVQARDIFTALGDAEGAARALAEMVQIELDAGNAERALHMLDTVDAPPPAQQARWQALRGNAYLRQGRFDAALTAHTRALELTRQGAHRINRARAFVNLGQAQLAAGALDVAEDSFLQALNIMEQTHDVLGRVRARANLAVLYARRGHHRRALDLLDTVLVEQEAFGDRQGAAVSRQNLAELRLVAAEAALKRGQVPAAIRHLDAGRALYGELGMDARAAEAARVMAELRAEYRTS